MNITNKLLNVRYDDRIGYSYDMVREEAYNYLTNLFPDISYNHNTDSYIYKGYEFDYFRDCITLNHQYIYTLVDKNNNYNRLRYPENWGDFLEIDYIHQKRLKLKSQKESIWAKIRRFLSL